MKHWIANLKRLGACSEALDWCDQYATYEEAWQACQRGDWMLWSIGKQVIPGGGQHKRLVLSTCQCARLVPQSNVGLKTLEATEAWARGEDSTTLVDLRRAADATASAADAAYAAADAAYAADATVSAAHAAAYAAYAAYAAHAAAYAADAAYAAADADDDARIRTLKGCAGIVRGYFPSGVVGEEAPRAQ